MAARHSSIHEVPETMNVFERTMPNGEKLEYRMRVLQQPERARACGMGAKCECTITRVDINDLVLTAEQPTRTVDRSILHLLSN